ncbi:MAG: phosphate acetyltransferase [Theionarchaea archaeon]|nr:phosphate acetyltransferase [Theionarchaea archaeon]
MIKMDLMKRLGETCMEAPKKIVLPEGEDPRIIEAAIRVQREGLANPILISEGPSPELDSSEIPIVYPRGDHRMDSYVRRYLEMRGGRGVDERIASRVLSKPLHYGSMMVGMGDADGVVAGADNLTASVIKAGKLLIGLEEGISEPSSFFIMDVPGRNHLVFADCAVNPDPDSELLAQIAVSSASSARALLGVEPRVAMLSFSTKGSADHPHVRKVIDATKIAIQMDPALKIDGEMQADSALVPEIAKRKRASDILDGGANVLVFPDLDAGNIAYKLVQHLARASAFGPFLQGFRRPINDLSRGCTVEEVIGTILVTSVQTESNR